MWIDFAGIDQDNRRDMVLGISKLPAYISCCIEMIFYYTPQYESRAWTRVERCIAYTYVQSPLFVFIDGGYASTEKALDIDDLVAKDPSCFMKEPKTGGLLMSVTNPNGDDANITDVRDRVIIQQLLDVIQSATPLCPAMKMAMGAAAAAGEGGTEASAFLKFKPDGETWMPVDVSARAGKMVGVAVVTHTRTRFCRTADRALEGGLREERRHPRGQAGHDRDGRRKGVGRGGRGGREEKGRGGWGREDER